MRFSCTLSLLPLMLVAGLGGCAGPVETHVRSEGAGVRETAMLMWAPDPEGEAVTPTDTRAREAVAAALLQRGFRFSDAAGIMVAVGLAERPAGIAVEDSEGRALSAAKNRRLLQSCDDRLIRLRISMTDSATGETLYGGEAQEAHCHAGLEEVLSRLADRATADMNAPGGDRVFVSFARD